MTNVFIYQRNDDMRLCYFPLPDPRRISTAELVPALNGELGDGEFIYDPWQMDPREDAPAPKGKR